MRYRTWSLGGLLLGALLLAGTVWAARHHGPPKVRPTPTNFTLLATVQLPNDSKPLTSFDITWFDPVNEQVYFADQSNKAVDQINSPKQQFRPPTFVQFINKGKFAGVQSTSDFDANGPDGVITFVTGSDHELWVGDSTAPDGSGNIHGQVWSFTIPSSSSSPPTTLFAPVSTDCGPTGVTLLNADPTVFSAVQCPPQPWERADEGAYDPKDNLIMIANPHPAAGTAAGKAFGPYVTFIDAGTGNILAQMIFPQATGGLEQSVWDPVSQSFFMNLPQDSDFSTDANGNPVGGVAQITITGTKPLSATVIAFPTQVPGPPTANISCEGNGLALNASVSPEQLLIGCSAANPLPTKVGKPGAFSLVMKTDGTPVAAPATGGSDEVWWDEGDDTFYLAEIFASFATVPPGVTSTTPALGVIDGSSNGVVTQIGTSFPAHTVAADSNNDHVFMPMPSNIMAFDNSAGVDADDKFVCTSGCVVMFGPTRGEAKE